MTNIQQGLNDLALAGTILAIAAICFLVTYSISKLTSFIFFKIKNQIALKRDFSRRIK